MRTVEKTMPAWLTRRRNVIILVALVAVIAVGATFVNRSLTIYGSQVIVAEPGAAIGINPLVDRIDFGDVPVGQEIAKSLNLTNNGGVDNYIAIFVVGGIGDLVSIDPNFFTLKSGDEVEVQFRLIVPPSPPVDSRIWYLPMRRCSILFHTRDSVRRTVESRPFQTSSLIVGRCSARFPELRPMRP